MPGILSVGRLLGGTVLGWSPRSLFAASEPGGWYDPSDLTTLYQDAAGTTPVTAVEQPVGLVLDKSKGLTLGAELVTNGDFSSSAGWTLQSGVSITGGELVFTSSSGGAERTDTFTNNATHKVTIVVASYTAGDIQIAINSGTFMEFDINGPGTYTRYIRAGSTTSKLLIYAAGGSSTWSITSISVRELPGNHLSQSTSTARPVLSARVNALTYSENFSNAAWFKSGATATSTVLTASAGAGRHQVRQGIFSGPNAKVSIQYSPGTHLYAHLCVYDGGAVYATAIYELQGSGAVTQTANSTGTVATSTITRNIDGSFTCTLSATFTSSPVFNLSVGFAEKATGNTIDSSGVPTFTAVGTETISATYADARPSNAGVGLPAYQRVGAATSGTSSAAGNSDYDTTGFPLYLKFDGTDDFLVSGTIDPGSVDKAQVFAGVRKLGTSASTLAEYSVDSGANNGALSMFAPSGFGNDYYCTSRGTATAVGATGAGTYVAPITNVVSLLGDISGDLITVRANASQAAQATTDQGTGNYLNYPLYVGRRGGTSLPFNGHLYSLILRFSATNMDAATIASTETWVNSKTRAY